MTWRSSTDLESVTWVSPGGVADSGPLARFLGGWWDINVDQLSVSYHENGLDGEAVFPPGFGTFGGMYVLDVPTLEISGRLKGTGRRFKTPAQVPI